MYRVRAIQAPGKQSRTVDNITCDNELLSKLTVVRQVYYLHRGGSVALKFSPIGQRVRVCGGASEESSSII